MCWGKKTEASRQRAAETPDGAGRGAEAPGNKARLVAEAEGQGWGVGTGLEAGVGRTGAAEQAGRWA